jgi:putative transcriptional regulator
MLHPEESLEGKILIASPTLDRSCYFSKAVIYVLRHSMDGAVGLVINQPLPKVDGNMVVMYDGENIALKCTKAYLGGPVETEKGFVLHADDNEKFGADPLIKLSFDVTLLKAVAQGKTASKNSMFLFGYCGWGTGQLEEEIMDDIWMVARPDKKIIFEMENKHKWDMYLSALNINPAQYVDCAGTC